jgi:SnoaL-like domain
MSQENGEVVRRYHEAARALLEKRSALTFMDLPEYASLMEEYWHPQAVVDLRRLDGGIFHGPEGATRALRDWLSGWEEFDTEPKEYILAGNRVLVVVDHWGIAQGGMRLELRGICYVYTLRNGQFVHFTEYRTRTDALKAVGCWSRPQHLGPGRGDLTGP